MIGVVAGLAEQEVVASATVERVVAAETDERVVAAAPAEHVRSRVAVHGLGEFIAGQVDRGSRELVAGRQ